MGSGAEKQRWTNWNPTQPRSQPYPARTGSELFPSCKNRLRLDNLLTQELAAAAKRVMDGPVSASDGLDSLHRELAECDFERPRQLDSLLRWAINQLERGIVHVTHPRYLGLFNPAPTFPSQCADRISGAFNPQLATATTSPAAVAIELHVIAAVARRAGLPPGSAGHFTGGGSEANGAALVCALTQADPAFAAEGARAFSGQPLLYVSQDSHLAWIKLAHAAGIGRSAVRLVPTDGTGRMDTAALEQAVMSDRVQGGLPVMVAATAGTTNGGMLDPLAACAGIAGRFGLWFHVDAAWAGALIASPRLRPLLAGIEAADSVTIDAHKWFATTMGCGMFLTRHPLALSSAFGVSASYMPSNDAQLDPYVTSAQWSRRFNGLRLFLSLAAAGWSGYARHVEQAVERAEMLAHAARARGWSVVNQSAVAVLCLTPPAGAVPDVRTIVARVVASGRAWVSLARFEGQNVVRACITHGQATPADIAEAVEALHDAAGLKPASAVSAAARR